MLERLQSIRQIGSAHIGVCAFLILGIGSANAVPLKPPSVAAQLLFANPFEGRNIDTLGTFSLSRATGSLKFTSSGTPSPSLLAEATLSPFFFGRSSGLLSYEVEILGPAGDVPVTITANGSVTGTSEDLTVDTFAGFAMKSVWNFEALNLGPIILEEGIATQALTGSFSQSWSHTHDLNLTTNTVYKVTMIADAGVRAGSAAAFVDPIFSFGPNVDTTLYDFRFSDGIGNSPSTVSAPGGLELMSLGMAMVFAMARRVGGRARPSTRG